MKRRDETDLTINPGYASLQLAKALLTADSSEDPNMRDRAVARAEKWQRAFARIVGGTVGYESRTPLPDVPACATPEVVTGRLVTGNLLAGRPLQAHEADAPGNRGKTRLECK